MAVASESFEEIGSRATKVSILEPTQELRFKVTGSDDHVVTMAQVEKALTPAIAIKSALFGTRTLVLQEYEIKPLGNKVWEGTARYGRRQPRQTGDIVLSFDSTGGTAHISTSKETMRSYAASGPLNPPVQNAATTLVGGALTTIVFYVVTAVGKGTETLASNETSINPTISANKTAGLSWSHVPKATSYKIYRSATAGSYGATSLIGSTSGLAFVDAGLTPAGGKPPSTAPVAKPAPDCKGAIGVGKDTVEGTEIVVPVSKFIYQYYAPTSVMTDAYINTLERMAGLTNDAPWKGRAKGEVLYLGTTGQPRSVDDWELAMHFISSPNVNDLSVGDIENIIKGGHEYLWVSFADAVSEAAAGTTGARTSLIKIPQYVYIERVYDEDDFSQLGIGTGNIPPPVPQSPPPQFGQYSP